MITPIKSRRMAICTLLLVCLILCARPCLYAERLPLRTYTSADGLGSSFVNNLMRDSRGFLWVCTRDGLSRFDGSRFITYQVGDKSAPPGIEQILETRKGIYWIVTTGGLYRFDPAVSSADKSTNTDRPTLNAEFVGNMRAVLFEDRDGALWSAGDGLYRLEEKEHRLVSQKVELNLPANPSIALGIGAIVEGRDRSLWLLTLRGLVRRWPDGKEVFYTVDAPGANVLTSVLEDSDGRIWLGCLDGLYVIEPEPPDEMASPGAPKLRNLDKLAREQVSASDPIRLPAKPGEIIKYSAAAGLRRGHAKYLCQTSDKRIWISDADRLIEFDGQVFRAHPSAQSSISESGLMIEDEGGNLWLGNSSALMRLQRGGLTSYGAGDGLRAPYVVAINQTRDDKLYAVAVDSSPSLFDGKGFETVRPGLPPKAHSSWTSNAAFQDSVGEWWFLTTEKLYRFAATKDFHTLARQVPRATYDHRDGLKSDAAFHIFEDSHYDLWISTAPSGLSRWSRATEKFYTFSETEGFPPDKAASSFAEDRNGNLWFGFSDGGLIRFAEERFTEFKPADGAPNGLITALHLDRLGRLWIGSSLNGLSRVDDTTAAHPHFVPLTTDSGLASNNVRSITEDLDGNVYAGTARGVDRLSPDGTRIKHYSVNDGLAGDFVTAAFRDHSGALWFGTPNGLSRLVPEQEKAVAAPPVWISGLRIAGERRPVSELGSAEIPLIEMAHSQNNLQIDFFGIDFSAGETLRYQYQLEGADKEWSAPTLQRAVTYANMAPGAYRFLVRAVSADGLTSEKPAVISFKIMSPVWQRWWFLSLAVLVIIGIVYVTYRYRVAQLLKVEREPVRVGRSHRGHNGQEQSIRAGACRPARSCSWPAGDEPPVAGRHHLRPDVTHYLSQRGQQTLRVKPLLPRRRRRAYQDGRYAHARARSEALVRSEPERGRRAHC